METFFFIYTMTMLFVCVATASICMATYAVTHRKRHLPQAGFFAAYFIELSSIFADEWAGVNVSVVTAANYYAVDLPVLRIAEGAAILACFWFVVLDIMDMREGRVIAIASLAFVVLSAIPLIALPYGPLRQWLFYSARQASLAACLALAFVHYRRSADELYHQRMHRHIPLFIAVCVLTVCIFIEDTCVILLAPIPGPDSPFVGLFLSSRSFSENVMMLVVAYVVTRPKGLSAASTCRATSRTACPPTPRRTASPNARAKSWVSPWRARQTARSRPSSTWPRAPSRRTCTTS